MHSQTDSTHYGYDAFNIDLTVATIINKKLKKNFSFSYSYFSIYEDLDYDYKPAS